MTSIYAPTTRARRILIALLAFALAVALAIVASVAPAGAARDIKEYSVTVTPPSVNLGVPETYTVVFRNEGPTRTQRAGAFQIDFGAQGFNVSSVLGLDAKEQDGTPRSWQNLSAGDLVEVSADDGGERIGLDGTVTVFVTATATSPGLKTLESAADQQHHGNFNGGSAFDQPPRFGKPPITVISVATPCGQSCTLGTAEEWSALLNCTENCSYLINTPGSGDIADFDVTFDEETGIITIVMTTDGKGPSPGNAEVETDGGKILPDCGTSGLTTNCVHINRVNGNHTQYTVFWSGDPRFRFR